MASLVQQMYPNIPIYGQCHRSDLRQLETKPWQRERIKAQIPKLSSIFALHDAQKQRICEIFDLPPHEAYVMGIGYNSNIFFKHSSSKNKEKIRYLFAGKLSKKSVYSLLCCPNHLKSPDQVELYLVGGCDCEEELAQLKKYGGFLEGYLSVGYKKLYHLIQKILDCFGQMVPPKPGNGIMIRRPSSLQKIHEIDILTAGTLNFPGFVDAAGAAVQHNLK